MLLAKLVSDSMSGATCKAIASFALKADVGDPLDQATLNPVIGS
jgi:hypothetical protein